MDLDDRDRQARFLIHDRDTKFPRAFDALPSQRGDQEPIRFLIHDRDSKLTAAFDEVFRSDGIRTIRTPVRAARANAFIERWIGTVRRECLDRLLIVNRRHLERVLPAYISHYNKHRPHRSLHQRPPNEQPPPESETDVALDHVRRRDVLGGLIHEHKTAA